MCIRDRLRNAHFFADKGYDVKAIYNAVKDIYHGECFIPINKRNTKNPKKLSTGHPICEAGLAMHKDGKFSDNGRTRQKYCCPFKRSKSGCCPCNHKNWNNGKKTRGCTKYVTLPDDYWLSIDRECVSFKKIYALRTEAERYNSRFKQTGQERLWVHSFNAAQNLNSVAHIALLAVAHATVVTKFESSYRSLKSVKCIAWRVVLNISAGFQLCSADVSFAVPFFCFFIWYLPILRLLLVFVSCFAHLYKNDNFFRTLNLKRFRFSLFQIHKTLYNNENNSVSKNVHFFDLLYWPCFFWICRIFPFCIFIQSTTR